MKKTFFILSLLVLSVGTIFAQEEAALLTARGNELHREYLRPSLSRIFFHDGSNLAQRIVAEMKVQVDNKFNQNPLEDDVFSLPITIKESKDLTKEKFAEVRAVVDKTIKEHNYGADIMRTWFPRFDASEGGYTCDVLMERGNFAATDNDVLRAKSSARSSTLNELGEQLIDRSYLVAYFVYTIPQNDGRGPKAQVMAFAYKLDFGPEVMTTFYEQYFDKENGISQCTFPVKFIAEVLKGNFFVSASVRPNEITTVTDCASELLSFASVSLVNKISDFEIKTPVVKTGPVQAKIGTKENLQLDQRFYVMELSLNKEGKEVAKRRGAVRVDYHITDNNRIADGNMKDMTHFYQYQGAKLSEGMTLVEHPDFGVSIVPVISSNNFGATIEYRASSLISKFLKKSKFKGFTGLYVFAHGDLPFGFKDGFKSPFFKEGELTGTFYRMSFGIGKEFNFARFLTAGAQIGYGMVGVASNSEAFNKGFSASFLTTAARFGLYVHPNIQVFGQASYDVNFGVSKAVLNNFIGMSPFGAGLGVKYIF